MADYSITDLRHTIVPKSDQLNAEQLLAGDLTILVTDVRIGNTDEQPISIHYLNDGGRPYKPCKTMRKVLIFAWGADGSAWPGRSMTLYNDPAVKFGGAEVGGIRISHMSDLDTARGELRVSLTATKGKKTLHVIKPLAVQRVDHAAKIEGAATVADLKAAFKVGYRAASGKVEQDALKAVYDARMAAITAPPTKTIAQYIEDVDACETAEQANVILAQALTVLGNDDAEALRQSYAMAWQQ